MHYRLLGKSGLRVSELCLGTMTFGEDWGWGASKDESRRIFDAYAAADGNFIDTSCNYTNDTSEKFVGEFTKGDRDHFVIATKYSLTERKPDPNYGGNHRKNMRRSVEGSLKRLSTDYIDLLYLHMWDYTTTVEEVMRSLDDLVRAGKVLYAGISDTPAWIVAEANMLADVRGWSRFIAYQGEYSLASRSPEREILPMTRARQMSFLGWGLLEGGELTGKYNRPTSEPKRNRSADERNMALAEAVMQVASEIGRTPSQVAINWVLQRPTVSSVIIGARNEQQLRDNLGAVGWSLSKEQITKLDEASAAALPYPYWHQRQFAMRNPPPV